MIVNPLNFIVYPRQILKFMKFYKINGESLT